jgi:signal peptidase II
MRSLRGPVVLAVLAVDRASKLCALRELRWRGPVEILPFFSLSFASNTGASFGLGTGANRLLAAVSIVLIAVLARLMARWPKENAWLQVGGALVLAGAIGNLYDRVAYGAVVDFLDVHRFAVCNLADWSISAGAAMLAWGLREVRPAAA